MSLYKNKLNTRTGAFNLVPSGTVITFKEGVANAAALPLIGNTQNDARITYDAQHLYVWSGTAWVDQGDIIDLKWAAIEDKPSSSVADIDDAVSKKHTQGTDQGLDTGGANATTAADVKDAVDKKHSNSLDHAQGTDTSLGAQSEDLDMNGNSIVNLAPASIGFQGGGAITKSDYEDSITKKHEQNTDNKLQYITYASVLDQKQPNQYQGLGIAGAGSRAIYDYHNILPSRLVSQTFTAGITGILSKISFPFGIVGGTVSGNLNIQIQGTDGGGLPNGVILDEVNFDTSVITTDDWYEIILNGTANIIIGTKYAIVINFSSVVATGDGWCYIWHNINSFSGGSELIYYSGVWAPWLTAGLVDTIGGLHTRSYVNFTFRTYVAGSTTVNNILAIDVDDAVSKRHTQGTDQGLDTGGANATTVADVKDAVDKRHTQNTDQKLDEGGANEVSVSDIKNSVDNSHVQNTDTKLDEGGSFEISAEDLVAIGDISHDQGTDQTLDAGGANEVGVADIKNAVDSIASGISGTYTFGGGSPGDIASMTFVNGILTEVTTVS